METPHRHPGPERQAGGVARGGLSLRNPARNWWGCTPTPVQPPWLYRPVRVPTT